jgi:hypothetical protein
MKAKQSKALTSNAMKAKQSKANLKRPKLTNLNVAHRERNDALATGPRALHSSQ